MIARTSLSVTSQPIVKYNPAYRLYTSLYLQKANKHNTIVTTTTKLSPKPVHTEWNVQNGTAADSRFELNKIGKFGVAPDNNPMHLILNL